MQMATLIKCPLSTENYTTELKTSRRATDDLFQAGIWVSCALLQAHELTGWAIYRFKEGVLVSAQLP